MRVHWRGEPVVEWCWMDGIAFSEPAFAQTIERALRTPFSLLFRRETPIDALERLEPGLAPSGFVFHVSRCGSTLVSRCSPRCRSISFSRSRFPSTTSCARTPRRPTRSAGCARSCRRSVAPRRGDERAYVLKLDAWSACSLGTVRRAFPDVPWVFLFREPVQVLASHFRQRGAHMVPGAIDPGLFGLDRESIARMPPEEYCARVLAAICRAALEHRDEQALFVDYDELPGALFDRILGAFGLECDPAERARMEEVTRLRREEPAPLLRARRRGEGAGGVARACARRPTAGCGRSTTSCSRAELHPPAADVRPARAAGRRRGAPGRRLGPALQHELLRGRLERRRAPLGRRRRPAALPRP